MTYAWVGVTLSNTCEWCVKRDNDAGQGQVDMFSNIGEWSNDLANGMMTLEQEMAAFGEKMPEPKYRHGGKENERPDSDNDDDD